VRSLLTSARTRASPVFVLYVLLSAVQVILLKVTGVTGSISVGRLLLAIVLIAALGRRSRVAWWLLVALDVIPLLFSTLLLGPGVLWVHVALYAGSSVALLALLVSHPMRAFVSAGRPARPLGRTRPSV
jgi:hypothetical protein